MNFNHKKCGLKTGFKKVVRVIIKLYVSVSVYYESIKRKLNRRLILVCGCDERLKTKTEESTRLGYTV